MLQFIRRWFLPVPPKKVDETPKPMGFFNDSTELQITVDYEVNEAYYRFWNIPHDKIHESEQEFLSDPDSIGAIYHKLAEPYTVSVVEIPSK
jgi:hypothetical protein